MKQYKHFDIASIAPAYKTDRKIDKFGDSFQYQYKCKKFRIFIIVYSANNIVVCI